MSAEDREMANILAREDRRDRFQAVMNLIKPNASSILDLGCGIGSLALLLSDRFPSASIVGLDESKYLLDKLKSKRRKPNILEVQADAPIFPFMPKSFDLVVAVQVLHEIFHFKGEQALLTTINNVYDLLQEEGIFVVLDHRNPGETPISLRLSKELLERLRYFRLKFKPRKISYETLDEECVRMSMRDFYDFVTKIWAMGTSLEEEEMHETHTPFTEYEFAQLCQKAGFKIEHMVSITSIDSYLKHYKIDVKTNLRLPERHFFIRAKK
jgi:ubiquinone/menaquinone biosynthesis C-methylase UbiE